ncbi:hypothetical protein BJY04DRAFT_217898 [Aspergillus karnatakaensis]|uniref:FAD-binding oxidoreductase n=1 Tax=Aspergillus karnatakaensis TaxID=1810916 RepID=UPI003CCCFCBF
MLPRYITAVVTKLLAWGLTARAPIASAQVAPFISGFPGCDAIITAGLGHRLVFATDLEYTVRTETYWAQNSRLRPFCFFLPHNTEEVAAGLVALLYNVGNYTKGAGNWHIAVRSAGHNMGHSNNIEYGVTIDLFYLRDTSYDPATNLAMIGPGNRWQDVYPILFKHGVLVAGGRDGSVGVGGYLIGGGSSYHQAEYGFGCDTVKNFEVVLVNGTIVNANETHHRGLWQALRGGGSNFGIVTRFDMEAIPNKKLAYGQRFIFANASRQFVDATVDFVNNQEVYKDTALIATVAHVAGEDLITTTEVNTNTILSSPAFAQFRTLPQKAPFIEFPVELKVIAPLGQLPPGSWAFINTITFLNNRDMLNFAIEAHRKATEDLEVEIGVGGFVSTLIFQPVPAYFANLSEQRGGNMFSDLFRLGNGVICTTELMVQYVGDNELKYKIASRRFHQLEAALMNYALEIGAYHPYIDLNYGDSVQDPLGSYPVENVRHIRRISNLYDPQRKFQDRVFPGFKIDRVVANGYHVDYTMKDEL